MPLLSLPRAPGPPFVGSPSDVDSQYSATGERRGQSKKNAAGVWEDSFYGYNAHSDVKTLAKQDGTTRATYGYTAYGKDAARFTGVDKPTVQPDAEPYDVYRYNAKRWDPAS